MQFKKNIKYVSLPLAACTLLFSACVMDHYDEDLSETENRILSKGKYYLTVKIDNLSDAMPTRVEGKGPDKNQNGTVNGEENEHQILASSSYICLFDDKNMLKEVLNLSGADEHPGLCDQLTTAEMESMYVAQFNVEEDYEVPKSCLVILNGKKYGSLLKNGNTVNKISLSEVLGQTWDISGDEDPSTIGREGDYFTMTNSAYFDKDGKDMLTVPVPVDAIHKDYELPDPKRTIHVHVERMNARFTLETKNNGGMNEIPDPRAMYGITYQAKEDDDLILFQGYDEQGFPKYETRKWRARPTGWGMNALEKSANLFKTYNNKTYYPNWASNDPDKCRSYWAEDGTYDAPSSVYPWQYRNAIDVANKITYYEKNNNFLKNYSYNEFVSWGRGNAEGAPYYTPENTYNYSTIYRGLDQRADVLAGTHLIYTAELLVDWDQDGNFVEKDCFRDHASIFYETEKECFLSLVTTFNYSLQSQYMMRFHYYDWDQDGDPDDTKDINPGDELFIKPEGVYSLFYGDQNNYVQLTLPYLQGLSGPLDGKAWMLKGEVRNGDGKKILNPNGLTIRSTEDPSTDIMIPIYKIEEYRKEITIPRYVAQPSRYATADDIKSLFFEWTGAVDHFHVGKMYYFWPAALFEVDEDDVLHDKFFCGTVRNTWYKYVLNNIKSIGTSVDDPDQPIVPVKVNVNSQIEMNMKLLDWHNEDIIVNYPSLR